jgi:Spy/CpxP family protein refolding chaperone
MYRFLGFTASVLMVLVISATAALSQNRGRASAITWQPYVGLVGYWQVREELKLTADQIERIKKIGGDYMQEMQTAMRDQKLTGDERRKALSELSQRLEKRTLNDTKATLTDEQASRLRQMEIWDAGPLAFADSDVMKSLKLTEQQVGVLTTIRNEYMKKIDDATRADPTQGRIGGGISEEDAARAKARRDEIRFASETECLDVLTDGQKAEFKSMKGSKFELDLFADYKVKP